MSISRQKYCIKLLRQTKGSALLEFAFVSMLLLLIIMAIIDFGHAFLMRQAIVNASREAARYAVVYRVDANGNHLMPSNFSPTVQSVAENYLAGILPSGSYNVPTPTGAGYTTGTTGQPVTVTITAYKTWFAVDAFVSFFGVSLENPLPLTAATTMRCE
jgi:Flp pilus assembly protein TadG